MKPAEQKSGKYLKKNPFNSERRKKMAILFEKLKKFILLVSLVFLITSDTYADDNSRWQWVYSDSSISEYIDTNSIRQDSDNNIVFWVKTEASPDNVYMSKYVVDYAQKNGYIDYYACYKHDIMINEYHPHGTFSIYPDSFEEKIVNIACDKLSLLPILGSKIHSWKWAYSSANENYYLCTDYFFPLLNGSPNNGKICYFYLKTFGGPKSYIFIYPVGINFSEYKVAYKSPKDGGNWSIKEVVPDSIEEAIYNTGTTILKEHKIL